MTRPCWLRRAARNRQRHAIEQASRRWRGGRRDDSARTRRKVLSSTQVQNIGLWQSYCVKKSQICQREAESRPPNATNHSGSQVRNWLFHGCGPDVVDKILQQGFNPVRKLFTILAASTQRDYSPERLISAQVQPEFLRQERDVLRQGRLLRARRVVQHLPALQPAGRAGVADGLRGAVRRRRVVPGRARRPDARRPRRQP